MPATPPLTVFAPVEDGYIVGFANDGRPVGQVLRAIAGLDPWQRARLPHELSWWVSDDAITRLARRLPDVASALDEWRRYTASSPIAGFSINSGSTASNWRYVPADIAAAYLRLGLTPGAPREQVVARRRALTRAHHPDVGGEHTVMVAINATTDTVLAWLAREPVAATADPM